eukprot:scaffold303269_cov30-Tisochrysis_lutea.AAC.1
MLGLIGLRLVLLDEAGGVHVGREGDVERDARIRILVAQHVHVSLTSGLGGCVRCVADEWDAGGHRGDSSKVGLDGRVRSSALCHPGQDRPCGVDDAMIIDTHHEIIVLVVQVLKVLDNRRARCGDADVDRSELSLGSRKRSAQRGSIAHICGEDANGGIGRMGEYLRSRRVEFAPRARHQRDASTGGSCDLCNLEADTFGAAGEQHMLTRERL